MILQDDLGHFDTGFHNPDRLDVSSNVTALAKDGIVLTHHYVFYCKSSAAAPTAPPIWRLIRWGVSDKLLG